MKRIIATCLGIVSIIGQAYVPTIAETAIKSTESSVNIDALTNPMESRGDFDSAITVRDIEITGNKLISKDEILKELKTKKGAKFSRRTVGYDLKTLDDMGYFDPNTLMAIPVPQGDNGVVLRIHITENPAIRKVNITGNNAINNERLMEFLQPMLNKPRSLSHIKNTIDKIEGLYHDEGYLLAAVSGLHADGDVLELSIDEGQISSISFVGNDKTGENYLRHILPKNLHEGSAYNEKATSEYLQGLMRSGYFKNVKREFTPDENDPTKHKLSFTVEEQRTKSMSFGTGVGSLNGFYGSVTVSDNNLRGQGETLSVSTIAGTGITRVFEGNTNGRGKQKGDISLSIQYADPFFLDKDRTGFTATTGITRMGSWVVDSAIDRGINGGFAFNQKLNDKWSVQTGLRGSYNKITSYNNSAQNILARSLVKYEGLSNAAATTEAAALRAKEIQKGTYLDFTPSLTYRNVDLTKRTGVDVNIFSGPSLGLGGASSYLTTGIDVRQAWMFGGDGDPKKSKYIRQYFRAEGLWGDPNRYRFLRAAGPYGARGYQQFLHVGRGPQVLSNTMEIAFPLNFNFDSKSRASAMNDAKLVFFNDLGMAFGNKRFNKLYDRESFVASAGVGLEVNLPVVGPMRVDYGIPLIVPTGKKFGNGRIMLNPASRL